MPRPSPRASADIALALAAVVGFVVLSLRGEDSPGVEIERAEPPPGVDQVVVHIGGAVRAPGLVAVGRGARVADAVRLAGDALPDADLDAINLARRVEDGEQLIIPRSGDRAVRLLDLNRATRAQLVALAGIGEKTAERIIASRTETPFATSDDLVSRRLLSLREYEAIRDQVTALP